MMKKLLQAGLILLLVLGMLLAVSCKKDLVAPVDTSGNEEEESRDDDVQLSFPRADYKAELNVYYIDWGLYQDFFFSEDTGTAMNAAIYQRTDLVRDYLGVEVVGHPGSAGGLTYASELTTLILGGTDTYQLILTHCYQGITALVGGGYLKDFNDFEYISLDADYWNSELMNGVEVQGNAYLGSSDYMIKDPNVIFFNKDILADYTQLESPYKLVDDKEWTLDKMFQMAAQVDVVTEGATVADMTYGIVGKADWQAVAFADSCDCNWLVDNGGYKELNMSAANERYLNVFEAISEASDQDWFGLYGKSSAEPLTIDSCKTLFSYESLQQAYKYRSQEGGSDVKFGILPYPKYDVAQENYHSLNWSGFMAVPISVENSEMVEKTLEALAYFSQDTTVVAYYEKLLGARLAEAPDDARMLDVVFDGIVANPFFTYMQAPGEVSTSEELFYGITRMLEAKFSKTGTVPSVSGLWNANGSSAQAQVDKYLN